MAARAKSGVVRNGSRLNKIFLLRLDADGFDAQTKANAADVVLAYSAICPHTDCDVANWLAGSRSSDAFAICRITIRRPAPRWSAGLRRGVSRRCR